jgi:sigma-B regulation protein RsbU (phosphoserine phosphatase)
LLRNPEHADIRTPDTIKQYLENERKEYFELEQLVKIVHSFYRLSMEDMNNIIFSKLDEWRGNLKLVDDTAVFSCRFF